MGGEGIMADAASQCVTVTMVLERRQLGTTLGVGDASRRGALLHDA